jgi:thiaminase/transcriptional activator TenA
MTLLRDLWPANQDLAQACLEHLFVGGIATGTLPVSRFVYYIGQDRFFLQAFARAYCVAAARSARGRWGLKYFTPEAGGALEELKLQQSCAAEWGVDLGAVALTPATRRYVPPRHRLGG